MTCAPFDLILSTGAGVGVWDDDGEDDAGVLGDDVVGAEGSIRRVARRCWMADWKETAGRRRSMGH